MSNSCRGSTHATQTRRRQRRSLFLPAIGSNQSQVDQRRDFVMPSMLYKMRSHILLQLRPRTSLPTCTQRTPCSSVWVRFKSQIPRPSQKHITSLPKSKDTTPVTSQVAPPVQRTLSQPKTSIRNGMKK